MTRTPARSRARGRAAAVAGLACLAGLAAGIAAATVVSACKATDLTPGADASNPNPADVKGYLDCAGGNPDAGGIAYAKGCLVDNDCAWFIWRTNGPGCGPVELLAAAKSGLTDLSMIACPPGVPQGCVPPLVTAEDGRVLLSKDPSLINGPLPEAGAQGVDVACVANVCRTRVPTFVCGHGACDATHEVCAATAGRAPDGGHFEFDSCGGYPPACVTDRTCTCIREAGTGGTCLDDGDGHVKVEVDVPSK